MCGRFTLRTKLNLLLSQFAAEAAEHLAFEPAYNIAPTDAVLAVRLAAGRRQLARFYWSLIPSWSKTKKLEYDTWNAKAERVATAPAFRSAYKKRRCLVLADSYFEFEKQGKLRLPVRYEIDDGQPFALAGLWETWHDPTDSSAQPLDTCTILTTTPNELTRQVHTRMPVILDAADYDDWLAGEPIPLVPFPAERMAAIPNTTRINNSRHKGPDCIGPREE